MLILPEAPFSDRLESISIRKQPANSVNVAQGSPACTLQYKK